MDFTDKSDNDINDTAGDINDKMEAKKQKAVEKAEKDV